MSENFASLEILRWGYAHIPGAIFFYAKELELDTDDIGILAAIFYAFENGKPLYRRGVRAGQVLQACPVLSRQKLTRKLTKLYKQGLIDFSETEGKNFADRVIHLEPLLAKFQELIIRDHPKYVPAHEDSGKEELEKLNLQLEQYRTKAERLEMELENEKSRKIINLDHSASSKFKKVADFISKKTGNLLSVKMETELKRWLEEFGFTPEFLLVMLELAFERSITNPRDITKIARDIKEYSINTVDGVEHYFKNYVDREKNMIQRIQQFDPDIIEFGNFTGIDMNAEARKKIYYKWRYDWSFSHQMIMKAGEIMCQRTKSGGLEYIDSVLNNWMKKEIRSVAAAENEIAEFKLRNKTGKQQRTPSPAKKNVQRKSDEYELYVPPDVLEELKTNA